MSMSTPPNQVPATNALQCDTCAKAFKTKPALFQHSLDTGHGAQRCCTPCRRQFATVQALEAHQASSKAHQANNPGVPAVVANVSSSTGSGQSKLALSSSPQVAIPAGSSSSQPVAAREPEPLTCRGNTYTRIPKKQHHRTVEALKSLCHPVSTLRRHGYKKFDDDNYNGEFSPLPRAGRAAGSSQHQATRRAAVVIDCEMVGVQGSKSEIISLAAVDFLAGDELVNALVRPHVPVVQWRTNVHGISPGVLSTARAKLGRGQPVLGGWLAARAALFRHVDENTILIGHDLRQDLRPLRIHHEKIVDSAILASETVFGGNGAQRYWRLGLKTLCEELVGLKIRERASSALPVGPGKRKNWGKTHDGREDALATRELVLWRIQNEAAFHSWADDKRGAFELHQVEEEQRRRERQRKRQAANKSQRSRRPQASEADGLYQSGLSEEVLRWEDVVDWDMWPKSPPGSD